MKKINIIVIFFTACFLAFLIYLKYNKDETKILILGDSNLIDLSDNNYVYYLNKKYKYINYKFTDEYKKYNEIENDIKNNKYIYFKGKKTYLNQEISSSNIIIINANNLEYLSKCNKPRRIINEYNIKIYNDITSLVNIIKRISDAKIIVIGNTCTNNNIKSFNNNYYNYIDVSEIYDSKAINSFEYLLYKKIDEYVKN